MEVNKTSLVERRSASLHGLAAVGKRVTAIFWNFVRFWARQICRSSAPLQVKVLHVYNISKPEHASSRATRDKAVFILRKISIVVATVALTPYVSWINSRQVAGESVTTALPFTANRSFLRCSVSEIRSFLSTVLAYFELLVPSLNFVRFWAKRLPCSRNT